MKVKFLTEFNASANNRNFSKTSYKPDDIEDVQTHVADYLNMKGVAIALKMDDPEVKPEAKPEPKAKPKAKPRKAKPKADK